MSTLNNVAASVPQKVCATIDNGAFGLPVIQKLVNWLYTWGFWACLAAAILALMVWAMGNRSGHVSSGSGREKLIIAILAAGVLGILPKVINVAVSLFQSGVGAC